MSVIKSVQLIQYLGTIGLENKQEMWRKKKKRNSTKTHRAERVPNLIIITKMSSSDEMVVTLKGSQNVSLPGITNSHTKQADNINE